MTETNLFDIILYLIVGFYIGVFLCDKARLKFSTIAYPFVAILNFIKKLIERKESKDDETEKI